MDLSDSFNPGYYANAVHFTDANNGRLAGYDHNSGPKHYIRQTNVSGQSWQPATLNVPSLDIEFIGQTGYVLTTSQPLYKTTNGGTCAGGLLDADIAPCGGNGLINLDDILAILQAFAGEENCP